MANVPAPKPPKVFDEALLQTMVEPLTVRVERKANNQRTPIPLPVPEDGSEAGSNYDARLVRELEGWLVTEWSGGGLYVITVTDSSVPKPITMTWEPWYNPTEYPIKTPPTLASAHRDATGAPPAPPAPVTPIIPISQLHTQGRAMAAFPNGLPPGSPAPATPYATPYYPQPQQFYPMPAPPMPGTQNWAAWKDESEKREREAELTRLRAENERRAQEALAAKHAADLEREKQAAEARFQAFQTQMQAQITALMQKLDAANAAPKPNAELEAIRLQMAERDRQLAEERREREAERRETALRDQMRAAQEAHAAQLAELRRAQDERMRAMETLIASNQNKSDPMLQLFMEMQRQNADALKEVSRNGAQQMQQLQQQMLNPIQLMDFVRQGQQQGEHATERLARTYDGIVQLQAKVTENALAMQPAGPGAIDLIRDGIDKAGGLVERFVGGQQMKAQLDAQTQMAAYEVQARAIDAQHAQTAHAPPPPRVEAQLAGPPVEQSMPPSLQTDSMFSGKAKPGIPPINHAKRLGRTDQEWFGMILPNVNQLREQAGQWLTSLEEIRDGKRDADNIEGLSPDDVGATLDEAVRQIMAQQVAIPALLDLMFEKRYPDFVEVLLPNVNQLYRDIVTFHVENIHRAAGGLGPLKRPEALMVEPPQSQDDEDDGEGGEDGEVDDDAPEPDIKPAPKPAPNGKRR